MNAVVVYKSKYGAAKKYAEWISGELKCPLIPVNEADIHDISKYDVIIFGGGLYAGGIDGFSFIKKHYEKLSRKKVVLFTVGITHPSQSDVLEPIYKRHFTGDMITSVKAFHFPGIVDYKALSFPHRIVMSVVKSAAKAKKEQERTATDAKILETYGEKLDLSDKSYIKPLVEHVKNSE